MMARFLLQLVLGALAFLALPAAAEIRYFGYVGAADDDVGLDQTHPFTNIAHVSARADLADPFVRERVAAIAARGLKATVDLGQVLWCNDDLDGDGLPDGHRLCTDHLRRWKAWTRDHAGVLTQDKVLAFAILDEPFAKDADMQEYEAATALVKATFPWAKVWLVEAACVVEGYCPVWQTAYSGLADYTGSLPDVDWIGLDIYGIHPATDPTFQSARARLKARFPGKRWLYVMDAFWAPDWHGSDLGHLPVMGEIAREWYEVARADPDAILLGGFLWHDLPEIPGARGAKNFPCGNLAEHVAIGRAITRKARTQGSPPIGSFAIDGDGTVSGWVCDPDATLCEVPRVEIHVDGALAAALDLAGEETFPDPRCGASLAYRFRQTLPRATAGRTVTLTARDDVDTAAIPGACAASPGCVWTPHLRHFGYVGAGDDDLGLRQTRSYTDFSHLAAGPDPAGTLLRERVAALAQEGIQATVDLGEVFWCGAPGLCADHAARWTTWKEANAEVLTPDRVLAFSLRDRPFFHRVDMAGYERAARLVKQDFPWAKVLLVEEACAVRGSCGGRRHPAFARYAGVLADVDWIGLAEAAIRPATDGAFQAAVGKLKARFPGKPTAYVLEGSWDAAHAAALGAPAILRAVAREWYEVAQADSGAVLLAVSAWGPPGPGTIGSRDLACAVLGEHVAIGREITGKVRPQTGPPLGRLEAVDGGTAVGWACDPDAAVCENPQVQLDVAGALVTAVFPDRRDVVVNARCGTGFGVRFRASLGGAAEGLPVTAVARDLDGAGTRTLPSRCPESPACVVR